MIKNASRRLAFVVVLGLSAVATVGVSRAQSTGGVTGTDPVPKGCGCVTQPAPSSTSSVSPSSTTANTTSSGSTSSTLMQAVLVFLGAA